MHMVCHVDVGRFRSILRRPTAASTSTDKTVSVRVPVQYCQGAYRVGNCNPAGRPVFDRLRRFTFVRARRETRLQVFVLNFSAAGCRHNTRVCNDLLDCIFYNNYIALSVYDSPTLFILLLLLFFNFFFLLILS